MTPKHLPVSDWRKQRFLEWLCTPVKLREPRLLKDLAAELELERRTLTNWKQNPEFLEEWEVHYRRTIGNPGKVQEVMDALHATATDRDDPKHVPAAKQYLDEVNQAKPKKLDVTVSKAAISMTDEELAEFLAVGASSELERRQDEAS